MNSWTATSDFRKYSLSMSTLSMSTMSMSTLSSLLNPAAVHPVIASATREPAQRAAHLSKGFPITYKYSFKKFMNIHINLQILGQVIKKTNFKAENVPREFCVYLKKKWACSLSGARRWPAEPQVTAPVSSLAPTQAERESGETKQLPHTHLISWKFPSERTCSLVFFSGLRIFHGSPVLPVPFHVARPGACLFTSRPLSGKCLTNTQECSAVHFRF